jgi:hypothetical protein
VSVVVSAVSAGLNAEMYEALTGRVMPGDQVPDGCRLHIGGPAEHGSRVITVWESHEQVAPTLMAAAARLIAALDAGNRS